MSFMQKLSGNSVEIHPDKVDEKFKRILTSDEEIKFAFKSFRDYIVLTNKRLILSDVQGVTGSKVEYVNIPYHKISCFSLEAAGTVDLDVDFKIWVSGYGVIEKTIARGVIVTKVSKILAAYIC